MVTPSRGEKTACRIEVYGLVQGVGFRPFLHRIAHEHRISGWATNSNDCVRIHAEGMQNRIDQFVRDIRDKAPPLAEVTGVTTDTVTAEGFQDFTIRESSDTSQAVTQVSPDIATCPECLSDMNHQDHRKNYPFVNCTNCGPRFSIVEELPYDRERTTMKVFSMCPSCQHEYDTISDRRYHAQPNACSVCGPAYTFHTSDGETISSETDVLQRGADIINGGGILAVKGIGGFHLACDAGNARAVADLRSRKAREGKPLAVMARNLQIAQTLCIMSGTEERLLTSPQRPILLLAYNTEDSRIAGEVSAGLDTLGIMLPYAPIHYLIFAHIATDFIVLTSGNRSDEPIVIDDAHALRHLSDIADGMLCSNRPIHNRADDSVAFLCHEAPRLIRRSRGWVPQPLTIQHNAEGIIATGAELKNTIALGKGSSVILSQHVGDLKNPETYDFFLESMVRLTKLFRLEPTHVACDKHPDYLSSRYAEEMGLPVTKVQHHYAHIASCIAETGYRDRVIGVSFDGTGYGDDGKIWGSEFFVCDLSMYERKLHLSYSPLPGGDAAVEEPWRSAVSRLFQAYGWVCIERDYPFLENVERTDIELLCSAVESRVNCPETSSMGRLFDTVAVMAGLATHITFEAEGPMRLQAVVDPTVEDNYPFEIQDTIDPMPAIEAVLTDLRRDTAVGTISARFHNTVVQMITRGVMSIAQETGIDHVMLSGGVFQNRIVLERSLQKLGELGFTVYSNTKVPANDGGISLGQAAVAATRRC